MSNSQPLEKQHYWFSSDTHAGSEASGWPTVFDALVHYQQEHTGGVRLYTARGLRPRAHSTMDPHRTWWLLRRLCCHLRVITLREIQSTLPRRTLPLPVLFLPQTPPGLSTLDRVDFVAEARDFVAQCGALVVDAALKYTPPDRWLERSQAERNDWYRRTAVQVQDHLMNTTAADVQRGVAA